MSRFSVRFLFHLTTAAFLSYSIYYDVCKIVLPAEYVKHSIAFAGRWKYLTFITGVFHMVYYVLSTVDDLLGRGGNGGPLWKFRNYMFSSAVFPLGMFVATSFWSLYAIDRDLIFPKSMDAWFPSWLNHALHTSIVPFDFTEVFMIPHVYPTRKTGLMFLSLLMVAYTVWVLFIAFHTHFWVYPILAVLNWTYRGLFIAVCVAVACLFYLLGEKLNASIWGKTGTATAGTQRLKRLQQRAKVN